MLVTDLILPRWKVWWGSWMFPTLPKKWWTFARKPSHQIACVWLLALGGSKAKKTRIGLIISGFWYLAFRAHRLEMKVLLKDFERTIFPLLTTGHSLTWLNPKLLLSLRFHNSMLFWGATSGTHGSGTSKYITCLVLLLVPNLLAFIHWHSGKRITPKRKLFHIHDS